jgi:hypothetical protein
MRVDGRTDMTKVIVAFRKFANAAKNCTFKAPLLINFIGSVAAIAVVVILRQVQGIQISSERWNEETI